MTFAAKPLGRRPAGRGFLLLVLAVLAGVLGMHALAPSPLPTAHAGTGHTMVMAHTEADPDAAGDCSHPAGGSDHLDHADGTCAAAGVSSSYAPPALSAAFGGVPAAVVQAGAAPEAPVSTRAPPDLSELQLLRI
ncbi:DUF6153 family protein [Streptomyces sp. NPDC090131]|uniref:DUF6153 family protein n=1 Tax=Streptomyces sp. NPDC090131 TaxID=3365954 RepID=UPI00380A02EA